MVKRSVFCLVACLLWNGAGTSGAVAGQVVILSSTTAEYSPGSIVDGTSTVSLPGGGLLMFNDATGATRTLTGPYTGTIEQSSDGGAQGAGVLASLSRLVVSRAEEQAKLGAIRALPSNLAREVNVVSVARSAVQCAANGEPVRLWRPETLRGDSRITMTDIETGAASEVLWQGTDASLYWPEDLPIRDGGRYRLKLDLAPRPVEITLRLVPVAIDAPAVTAAWMADAGCRRQALLLVSLLGE